MRTSTSCVLDGASRGEVAYVRNAERLMPGSSAAFEAPTVIKSGAAGQKLRAAPTNRGADAEDAQRGADPATLLVYLNDVAADAGGDGVWQNYAGELASCACRRFKGQCLVFFPASANGTRSTRVEHEGAETRGEVDLPHLEAPERRQPAVRAADDVGRVVRPRIR